MLPIVTFDSSLGKPDEHGRPQGLTRYNGPVPKKPQRWRVVVAANQKQLGIRVERDIRPLTPVKLVDLSRGTILPAMDEAIEEARQTINEVLGVEDSQDQYEISTSFEIFKWR